MIIRIFKTFPETTGGEEYFTYSSHVMTVWLKIAKLWERPHTLVEKFVDDTVKEVSVVIVNFMQGAAQQKIEDNQFTSDRPNFTKRQQQPGNLLSFQSIQW